MKKSAEMPDKPDTPSLADWLETPSLEIAGGLVGIPCSLYRGATSKGPVFLASDLPSDENFRNRIILAALNPEHPGQIDGVGGAETLSNKVIIVSKSQRPEADVDYTFLQITPHSTRIDGFGNSVNMGTSVGPFAVENGLVTASSDETEVRIFAVNSQMNYTSKVKTPQGAVTYEGDTAIDGVAGTSAPVLVTYRPPFGNLVGALFPTGHRLDVVNGVPITVVDAGGTVCIVFRADSFGRTGYESKKELDADEALAAQIEPIRQEAGRLIGLEDFANNTSPGSIMIAPPQEKGSIASRKLATHPGSPARCHAAYSGSGAVCLTMASVLSGTVASEIATLNPAGHKIDFCIEHPSGFMTLSVDKENSDTEESVSGISIVRTSRKLFGGRVYVPLQKL
ncbi:4-oxalomesaconate tautomerase [Pelagibius litoralis]|uniref:4-oxalomesaconate tautomerase n=1 Tax=Pelagibius litoralis TaxID=374515 RepID=A0A967KEW8_9PROT|nr:PrpF domain-containing protein [Pelagibius litoralis]NIA70965.1 4-oxalomesaconate tautomerase [Pelagibius litoralis]